MKKIVKIAFKGSEGFIKGYAFILFGKKWIVVTSETKWHAGDRFKRAPIWVSSIGGKIPALFIWKLAIGFKSEKNPKT